MAQDPNTNARFTRAYLSMNKTIESNRQSQQLAILTLAMISDAILRTRWLTWFDKQLDKAGSEEREIVCWIVRSASDGLWLSDLTQTPRIDPLQREAILEKLIQMTL